MTAHSITCQSCGAEVAGELYHLGFSNLECMYCDSCPRVLLVRDGELAERNGISWPQLKAGDAGWLQYDRHLLPVYEQFDALFSECVCGGRYRCIAAPRCPQCNEYLDAKGYGDKPILRETQGYVFVTVGSVTDQQQRKEDVA